MVFKPKHKQEYKHKVTYITTTGKKHKYTWHEPYEEYKKRMSEAKDKRGKRYKFHPYSKPVKVSGRMVGAMKAGITGKQYGSYHYKGRADRVYGNIEEVASKGRKGFHGGYVGNVVQPITPKRQYKPTKAWVATHKKRDSKGHFT